MTTTKEIKKHIENLGFKIGQTRKTNLDTMYIRNRGKYSCDLVSECTHVKGIKVQKTRGFNEIVIDCSNSMNFINGVGNVAEVINKAKKINTYLINKGYKTEYYNGQSLTITF